MAGKEFNLEKIHRENTAAVIKSSAESLGKLAELSERNENLGFSFYASGEFPRNVNKERNFAGHTSLYLIQNGMKIYYPGSTNTVDVAYIDALYKSVEILKSPLKWSIREEDKFRQMDQRTESPTEHEPLSKYLVDFYYSRAVKDIKNIFEGYQIIER